MCLCLYELRQVTLTEEYCGTAHNQVTAMWLHGQVGIDQQPKYTCSKVHYIISLQFPVLSSALLGEKLLSWKRAAIRDKWNNSPETKKLSAQSYSCCNTHLPMGDTFSGLSLYQVQAKRKILFHRGPDSLVKARDNSEIQHQLLTRKTPLFSSKTCTDLHVREPEQLLQKAVYEDVTKRLRKFSARVRNPLPALSGPSGSTGVGR